MFYFRIDRPCKDEKKVWSLIKLEIDHTMGFIIIVTVTSDNRISIVLQ